MLHRSVDLQDTVGRRRVLAVFVAGALSAIGASLATVLGLFALRPARTAAAARWVRAASLADLTPHTPVPTVVSVREVDGWYRSRVRRTLFLVWDGDRVVRAMSATCSHLGCQVAWNAEDKSFHCPCHGGVYDADGRVVSGPPPRSLSTVSTELRDGHVMVQL